MCMPDDENVVGWLVALQASKGLSHQQIMWKDESSNYRNYNDEIIELADEEEDLQNSIIGDTMHYAMEYYLKYMEKIPCRTSILTGRAWIQELFDGHVARGEQNLHMPPYVFQALCDTLRSDFGLWVPTRPHGLHIEESVAMFIHTLDGCTNRKLQEQFQHSGETVAIFPYNVGSDGVVHRSALALDGTHVKAVLPVRDAGAYYGRKGYPTQNILAVCDFDMKGYLAPYKGSRYHQVQFRDRGRPDNPRELFNEAYASLRSMVERTFGVWKSRWKFLNDMLDYDFATVQVPLVGASMALHNFIRKHEIVANAHNEYVRCSSVPDDMPAVEGRQNMDDGHMVGNTDVHMARVRVRIRDHLFHIRNQGLL
ncbi:uncharacterized protein LOC114303999 [Camellia sinensis]|uniref:uncharacterized protein LOC114303999 n=1 Tax=Camellia sinensis TaxID=4442 RepID=UPI001035CD19|nr:uncharacterized protein LOC114303999 [Camellia sinensis]